MKLNRAESFEYLEPISQPQVGAQNFAGLLFSPSALAGTAGEPCQGKREQARPARTLCYSLPKLILRLLWGSLILIALTLMLPSESARARQASGELRGQVTDELGGLVVGATVTLTNASGVARSTETDRDGSYLFSEIGPGRYSMRVEARGFSLYERALVEVALGSRETLNLKLSVALEKQEVMVGLETSLSTASENNASALVLGRAELEALPDDPDDLGAALQALAGPSAGPDGGQIFVDGFTDGRLPPKNSIREIRINSNPFSAEYNRLGFGRIEIFTKPGTDTFHGQASLNFSNQSLNSRNPFASRREPYRFLLYGANLSGPVIAKRASFFLDFERRDINDNSIINATILDPSLNFTPFALAVVTPQRRTTFSPRFDYQLNRKNTLVARYTYLRQGQENAGVGNFSLPSRAYHTSSTEQTLQLTETAVLSPLVINETRFQYSRRGNRLASDNAEPTINVLDAFTGGGATFGPTTALENRFELQNYTTFLLGRHALKAGVRLRDARIKEVSPVNFGGTFTFAGGLAPLLDANNQIVFEREAASGNLVPKLVQITSLERYRRTLLFERQGLTPAEILTRGGGPTQFSLASGNAEAGVAQDEFSLFVQDEWNLRPNLTLSMGLRYDAQNNLRGRLNLAPRAAFAYAPGVAAGGKTRTVIRGGFGIFFDRFSESLVLQANHFNEGDEQQFISTDPNILGLFPAVPTLAVLANSAASLTRLRLASNLQLPYIMQGAINLERQLPFKFVFTATWLGARAFHLLRSRNINAPLQGTFNPAQPETGIRPLGNASGNIFEYESSGRFNQNQLIVSLRNPVSSKMSIIVTYVLSKARGDTDGAETFPVNSYDLNGEYGRSDLDIRHRFNMTGVFSLKYGFSLNPFILAASGRPFNITTGRDANGDTLFTERPAFVTDPNQEGVIRTRFGVFNPNPRSGEPLVPRNYGTSASFFTVSLRVSKTWGFGQERRVAASSTPGPKQADEKKKQQRNASQASGASASGSLLPDSNRSSFFGKAPDNPYKVTFSIVARNIFNRTNPGRSIGNLNSLLFGQSNFLAPPYGFGDIPESNAANRRIEAQIRFSF